MAILEPIVAAIDAVSGIVTGIDKIGRELDGARSCVLIVENTTPHRLERIGDGHSHGGFAVTPSAVIPPRSVAIFGSQDKGFMTGCAGYVLYQVDDKQSEDSVLRIEWSNPFVGSNTADGFAWANGGKSPHKASVHYHASKVCGAGDKKAEMRYSLLPRE
jgi:hypothetical protein